MAPLLIALDGAIIMPLSYIDARAFILIVETASCPVGQVFYAKPLKQDKAGCYKVNGLK